MLDSLLTALFPHTESSFLRNLETSSPSRIARFLARRELARRAGSTPVLTVDVAAGQSLRDADYYVSIDAPSTHEIVVRLNGVRLS